MIKQVFYDDGLVTLDTNGLTIRYYHFPLGTSKHIPYTQIKGVQKRNIRLLTGLRRMQTFFAVLCIASVYMITLAPSNTAYAHAQTNATFATPNLTNDQQTTVTNAYGSINPGLCLGITGESTDKQVDASFWVCNKNSDQTWILKDLFVYSTGDDFELQNLHSHLCLGFYKGTSQQGAVPIQWPCNHNTDQRWTYYTGPNNPGSGEYTDSLINLNDHMCLGLENGTIASGISPIQWPCNGNHDQTWLIGS